MADDLLTNFAYYTNQMQIVLKHLIETFAQVMEFGILW